VALIILLRPGIAAVVRSVLARKVRAWTRPMSVTPSKLSLGV
jgi:hypothetical protein